MKVEPHGPAHPRGALAGSGVRQLPQPPARRPVTRRNDGPGGDQYYEVREAEAMMRREGIAWLSSAHKSIEEIVRAILRDIRSDRLVY